jgi:hypothetical protein
MDFAHVSARFTRESASFVRMSMGFVRVSVGFRVYSFLNVKQPAVHRRDAEVAEMAQRIE